MAQIKRPAFYYNKHGRYISMLAAPTVGYFFSDKYENHETYCDDVIKNLMGNVRVGEYNWMNIDETCIFGSWTYRNQIVIFTEDYNTDKSQYLNVRDAKLSQLIKDYCNQQNITNLPNLIKLPDIQVKQTEIYELHNIETLAFKNLQILYDFSRGMICFYNIFMSGNIEFMEQVTYNLGIISSINSEVFSRYNNGFLKDFTYRDVYGLDFDEFISFLCEKRPKEDCLLLMFVDYAFSCTQEKQKFDLIKQLIKIERSHIIEDPMKRCLIISSFIYIANNKNADSGFVDQDFHQIWDVLYSVINKIDPFYCFISSIKYLITFDLFDGFNYISNTAILVYNGTLFQSIRSNNLFNINMAKDVLYYGVNNELGFALLLLKLNLDSFLSSRHRLNSHGAVDCNGHHIYLKDVELLKELSVNQPLKRYVRANSHAYKKKIGWCCFLKLECINSFDRELLSNLALISLGRFGRGINFLNELDMNDMQKNDFDINKIYDSFFKVVHGIFEQNYCRNFLYYIEPCELRRTTIDHRISIYRFNSSTFGDKQ